MTKYYVEFGEVEKEYREVARTASVGDYVTPKFDDGYKPHFTEGGIYEVIETYNNGIRVIDDTNIEHTLSTSLYKTLKPTSNFRYGDKLYKSVDRKAEVGDLIVVTMRDDRSPGRFYDVGHIGKVVRVINQAEIMADFKGFENSFVDKDGQWYVGGVNGEGDFRVIEAVEVDGDCDLTNEKHIIELSKTVAKLTSQVNDLQQQVSTNTDNIRTFGEDVTKADYKAGQALTTSEQFAEDIEKLDTRTQPLIDEGVSQFAEDLAEMIERKMNDKLFNENRAIRGRFE